MSNQVGKSQFNMRSNLAITWGVFIQRVQNISRYKAALFIDMLNPLMTSLFPILMGIAIAGGQKAAETQFHQAVGTDANFFLFMILSANTFQIMSGAIFNFGFFLRREQVTGTLESLYLAPVSQIYILIGTGFYALLRALLNFVFSVLVVSIIFGVNPLSSPTDVLLTLIFLIFGIIPLFGIAFLFGSMILKYKDMQSIQTILVTFIGFLMGMFFPITLFPVWLQRISLFLPPTWLNADIRAALTGTSWVLHSWFSDFGMILFLGIIYPILGTVLYLMTDRSMRKTSGLGVF